MRLHPTSEEGRPTSCANRDGAPRVGPATRIGEKRGRSLCWGQFPTCVLWAVEEMVLRGEAHVKAASLMPPARSGGHRGSGNSGRGTAGQHSLTGTLPTAHTPPVPHCRDKDREGPRHEAPGQTRGQSREHTTGARPSRSRRSSGDWPGQRARSMWVLLGLEPCAYNRA